MTTNDRRYESYFYFYLFSLFEHPRWASDEHEIPISTTPTGILEHSQQKNGDEMTLTLMHNKNQSILLTMLT